VGCAATYTESGSLTHPHAPVAMDDQTPYHVLQDCPTYREERNQVWPEGMDYQKVEKLGNIHQSKNLDARRTQKKTVE
jgi:hypothetical protein